MAMSSNNSRDPRWLHNAALFWAHRRTLLRVGIAALVFSSITAFLLPKHYVSTARILPPQQTSGGAAMLAALAGHAGAASGLGSLAGGLLGGHSTDALYVNLLHSNTVSQHLIERFELQRVYRKRYVVDTAKKLAYRTKITEDNKSGVITISVEDTSRQRARDLAQAYVDELNQLVALVNTSSAHRERGFIEQRLTAVRRDLQLAQLTLSAFSTQHAALDIREQTRASIESSARMQAQLIVGESELSSLRQIYGNQNVRVRAAEARVGTLQHALDITNGSVADTRPPIDGQPFHFPAISQLPALAVTWTNLYRDVRIQETLFEMLSAQCETARIEEAKSIPSASIIDAPGVPEKKSSPHRLWIMLLSTVGAVMVLSIVLILGEYWAGLDEGDTRRILARQMSNTFRTRLHPAREAR